MQLDHAAELTANYSDSCGGRTFEAGNDPAMLTSIYDDNINIAIWQRSQRQILDLYAKEWMSRYPYYK